MKQDLLQYINRRKTWTLGLLLVLIITTEIISTIIIPEWNKFFFNQLEIKSYSGFIRGIWYGISMYSILALAQGLKTWVGQLFALNFRTALSRMLEHGWTNGEVTRVRHADQRIAEDCKLATDLAVRVVLEIIISGTIVIGLVIYSWDQPVILVTSFIYTGGVLLLAALFKKPMIYREIDLQKSEAEYRFSLSKLALQTHTVDLHHDYKHVKQSYIRFIKLAMQYTLFNKIQNGVASIVPFLLLVPSYFAGTIMLGGVMEGVGTFSLIVINASILVMMYPEITKAQASWYRIREFYQVIKGD